MIMKTSRNTLICTIRQVLKVIIRGSYPTWDTLKSWNFVIYIFQRLENVLNLLKKWQNARILTENIEKKTLKFVNSMFRYSLFKMSFTKRIIYIFVIATYSNTNTVIWSQIDLGFNYFYLEITWKIDGISYHQRSGGPCNCMYRYMGSWTSDACHHNWPITCHIWFWHKLPVSRSYAHTHTHTHTHTHIHTHTQQDRSQISKVML